jgi:hypothetical protein
MVRRKGMGKGTGKGYKNMMCKDPMVHSQSAKGMKQPQKIEVFKLRKKPRQFIKNENIAETIENFGRKHELLTDTRIYFNNMAWDYDSYGKKKIMKDIKASDYFEYADDKSVSVSTEGGLYGAINNDYGFSLSDELIRLLSKKHKVYYELGNRWNFTIYPQ